MKCILRGTIGTPGVLVVLPVGLEEDIELDTVTPTAMVPLDTPPKHVTQVLVQLMDSGPAGQPGDHVR